MNDVKREILFRGKRKDNGKWIEGNLVVCVGRYFIYVLIGNELVEFEVDPETVGQYTGQDDENGEKIFEGDVVLYESDEYGVIEWDNQTARFVIEGDGVCYDFDNFYGKELEVIGNIHDNEDFSEEEK